MTPGARVSAAIEVLDAWLAGAPVEQALTNWARGARYAGAKDRAALRDHVYDVLRARGSCAQLGSGGDGRALMLGLLRLHALDPAAYFTGIGHAPAPLAPQEAQAPPGLPDPTVDVPGWLLPLLETGLGAETAAVLAKMRDRAPLYLRVNSLKTTRAAATASLAEDGITAEPDPSVDTALLVASGARRVKSARAFADGWVEPQDLSVQRAVRRVDWADQSVLDYCAGGGGKSLAIAALGARRIVAHDADPRRMSDLAPRAARAGARIAIRTTAELATFEPCDVVLCDVPCSGSGTWRRDPEAKWRLTPDRLTDLVALQVEILERALRYVRPGGRLIYMTCSLFPVENEGQVQGFLERHPSWRCLLQGAETPLSASDGFFFAVLEAP